MITSVLYAHHCTNTFVSYWVPVSVGTVLIFQFNPGCGTGASVPAVPRYWFWYLGSGSYFSIPGFRYKVCRGLFAFVSFWYRFGFISVQFQFNFGPKAGGT